MKKQMYSKLLSVAVLSTIFTFNACQKAEVADNQLGKSQNGKMIQFEKSSAPAGSYSKSYPALKTGPVQVVNNGGFESGFSGWNVSATGNGINGDLSQAWIVGATDPNATNFSIYYGGMPHSESLAHSGTAGASSVENASTWHRLYQDVTVPAGQSELRFWIRWKNQYGSWTQSNGGQNILVNLRDPGTDALLSGLFDASVMSLPMFSGGGDFNNAEYEYYSFNVSAFAGQTVRLEFQTLVTYYFLYTDLDDIELVQLTYPAQLDVKPGDGTKIQLKSKGQLPVALLSDDDFDATTIDLSTGTLGDDLGADTPISLKGDGTYQASFEDVNGDGKLDLVMHFDTQALIANGDLSATTVVLKFNGYTSAGLHVIGQDAVVVL